MHPPYFGILDKWIHTLPTNSLIFNPSSVYINIIHYITYIVRHYITKCGCETWSYIYYYLLWVGDINIYITYYLYCKTMYHYLLWVGDVEYVGLNGVHAEVVTQYLGEPYLPDLCQLFCNTKPNNMYIQFDWFISLISIRIA